MRNRLSIWLHLLRNFFNKWQEISGNRIKLVTVAPELENGLAFIEEVTTSGVVASLGHTDATSDVVRSAVEAGANHVTHLYNQMSPFHHREPGVVGAAFLEDSLQVEMIVDGIHSHPKAVELAYRQKGASGIILITDAMRAKGLPPGTYDLGGQDVEVTHEDARLARWNACRKYFNDGKCSEKHEGHDKLYSG